MLTALSSTFFGLVFTAIAAAELAAQTSGARLAVADGEIVYDVAGAGPTVVLLAGRREGADPGRGRRP